jgi:hypothetical protein
MEDLVKKHVLGKVIEFQKRGLPHAHILLILNPEDKPRDVRDIDGVVSAEIPDPVEHPLAYETVTRSMMHGPCGDLNPNAPCMKDGQCAKKYPRAFVHETYCVEDSGYPVYRRRNDGRTLLKANGVYLDNRWVVPHNIYLCTKYNAHINVEICSTLSVVKYLYKYVDKGHDRASVVLIQNSTPNASSSNTNSHAAMVEANEIKKFVDARYVSAPEASWRIFAFSLHKEFPAHQG